MNTFRTFDECDPTLISHSGAIEYVAEVNKLRVERREHYDTMEFGLQAFDTTGALVFEGQGKTLSEAICKAYLGMRSWKPNR